MKQIFKKMIAVAAFSSLSSTDLRAAVTYYNSEGDWLATGLGVGGNSIQLPFATDTITNQGEFIYRMFDPSVSYLGYWLAVIHNGTSSGSTEVSESSMTIAINPGNGITLIPSHYVNGTFSTLASDALGIHLASAPAGWFVEVAGQNYPVQAGFMGWESSPGAVMQWSAQGGYGVTISNDGTAVEPLVLSGISYSNVPEISSTIFALISIVPAVCIRRRL